MKLDIPFFPSQKETDCGIASLEMALAFFKINKEREEIAREERQLASGMVWSLGIARAAAVFGCDVSFYSLSLLNPNNDLDFYQEHADPEAMSILKQLTEEAESLGVNVEKKDCTLSDLTQFIDEGAVPIVLLNWYIISKQEGFYGHFVPVSGYTDTHILIHNPGIKDAGPFMPIEKTLFEKAWSAEGTDKDVIVIKGSS